MKVSKNLLAVLALLMVVGLLLAACGGDTTTTTAAATGTTAAPTETTAAPVEEYTFKIGGAGPFTGDLAKIGNDALQAIQMAVEDFNASGAMPGVTFTVEVGDDGADPAKAATIAEKFSSDESVVGVVGPMTSGAVQAALPIFNDASLAQITQSATNVNLSTLGFSVFHRICPSDGVQGPSIAKFMIEDLKATSVFIIDDGEAYSKGLADQAEEALTSGGVTVKRAQIAGADKDFATVLTQVKEMNPSILFLPLPNPPQAAAIAKQMKSMGFQVQMFGADGTKDGELITAAGGATEGMYSTVLGPMPETLDSAKPFLDKYIAKYQVTSAFTAQSYEATNVLLEAIKTVGVVDGKIDREAVNAALSASNYSGILGFPIAFTPEGDLVGGGITVLQVKGTEFVPVKMVTLP
ncbi:MAG: branched-chain amino acid ABC transporter substrate-binding protein [Actinobacteria bacterium]|nr:branched-chain amino acid ABC transporter substrate-binding protein [Actinomycetota bacterium]